MSKIKAKSNATERETALFIDSAEFSLQLSHIVSETVKCVQREIGFPRTEVKRLREMALECIMSDETMPIKCFAIPLELLRKEGMV